MRWAPQCHDYSLELFLSKGMKIYIIALSLNHFNTHHVVTETSTSSRSQWRSSLGDWRSGFFPSSLDTMDQSFSKWSTSASLFLLCLHAAMFILDFGIKADTWQSADLGHKYRGHDVKPRHQATASTSCSLEVTITRDLCCDILQCSNNSELITHSCEDLNFCAEHQLLYSAHSQRLINRWRQFDWSEHNFQPQSNLMCASLSCVYTPEWKSHPMPQWTPELLKGHPEISDDPSRGSRLFLTCTPNSLLFSATFISLSPAQSRMTSSTPGLLSVPNANACSSDFFSFPMLYICCIISHFYKQTVYLFICLFIHSFIIYLERIFYLFGFFICILWINIYLFVNLFVY